MYKDKCEMVFTALFQNNKNGNINVFFNGGVIV